MKSFRLLGFALFSGCTLALSWPHIGGLTEVIFLSLLPLLWVEHLLSHAKRSALSVFAYAYLTFFVFNLLTTWWIKNADFMGACMAIICNSFFMATVFWLFHLTKKWIGEKEGYISLPIYWLAFEYLHLNWELSWSWLTFGNAFATDIKQIQWYEYTGVLGGSLWVLTINVLTFKIVKSYRLAKHLNKRLLVIVLLVFLTPKYIGYRMFNSYQEGNESYEFVVVQPNIDPYKEKFSGLTSSDQIDRMVQLAKKEITKETDYLILPETAFPEAIWEHSIQDSYGYQKFKNLVDSNPKLKVIVGLSSALFYEQGAELSETAKQFRDASGWYDEYNTAILIDSTEHVPIHHKSKLVLGVEKLPFVNSIPFIKKLSINLGGTSGQLGTQSHPSVFFSADSSVAIAPIICYESIFGEYVNQYAQSGANIFTIITNDGWWGDTPGYKQHLSYASLRAIENRRSIARSANTGISAFINQKGEISDSTPWWEQAVIKQNLNLNNKRTFYSTHGDYIGRVAAFIALLTLLLTVVKKMNKTASRLNLKKQMNP